MQGTARALASVVVGLALTAASVAPRSLGGQERGAVALGELVAGLGVNTRVLMIGAHPDDEDTFLITWLQRGRHVETAYLSLTRGDGGQNLIGNELGEALGVIRTEELLAARRIDGARQYFTRAFDFGFSKDTVDTYRQWQRDSILNDVVRVVRAFRPHVIVAVFSGTTRDGHGQHQVSGLLARAAYDIAADTMRFAIKDYGSPWAPLKFYRAARFNPQSGTLTMDVGEYSPLLGRSFGEIAGESRSQHKSQGFGALQRKGPIMDYVRREATRVNEATAASSEKSIVDGLDTTWSRFDAASPAAGFKTILDAMSAAMTAVRKAYDPFAPEKLLKPLSRALMLVRSICPPIPVNPCERVDREGTSPRRTVLNGDLTSSLDVTRGRLLDALRMASGVTLEAESVEAWAVNTGMPVLTSVYNRGRDTVAISGGLVSGARGGASMTRLIPPGGMIRDTLIGRVDSIVQPWWLGGGRVGGMFSLPASAVAENRRGAYPAAWYSVDLGGRSMGERIVISEPVVMRAADQVKGEFWRPVAPVPPISISVGEQVQYAPANVAIDRVIQVRLHWSAPGDTSPRDVRVTLALPKGLSADSATRTARISGYFAQRTIAFRVRGRLPAGEHRIDAMAESDGASFSSGYELVDYDHIRRQRIYRPASILVSAVDVRIPSNLRVAYITGVGDNIAPTLAQLGVPVTVIPATEVTRAELNAYTTVVIGPRAYEAHPELLAANPKLFDFARKGGVLLVQYGQFEMTQPGMMPFPIALSRPTDRVTHEDAPVTIDAAGANELTYPNRITAKDFDGWVQERGLYMPRAFDPAYQSLLFMNDPNESPNKGGVLIAPLGNGAYVYTTLSFFRQLPAGVPGGARLFVNLLSAKLAPPQAKP